MNLNGFLRCLALFVVFACGSSDDRVCPDASCGDYNTQSQAQAAFDADKDCLGELDHDSDGIACEHLTSQGGSPSPGGSSCPTTNNCGCSNKNKDQCGGDCCKWVVGTGCQCK